MSYGMDMSDEDVARCLESTERAKREKAELRKSITQEEWDQLKPEDLIIQVIEDSRRAPWARHTEKGVKVYHKPSGLEKHCEEHRSQHQNKHQALCDLLLALRIRNKVSLEDNEN